jgi:hypothetical protein
MAARTMTVVTASDKHHSDAVPIERLPGSQASTIRDESLVFTRDPLLRGVEWLVFFGVLCLSGLVLPVFASTAVIVVLGIGFAEIWVQKIELDSDNQLKIGTITRTRTFLVSNLLEVLFDRKVGYLFEAGLTGGSTGILSSAGTSAVFRFSTGAIAKLPFLGEAEFRRLESFAQDLRSRNNTTKVSVRYHQEPVLEGGGGP